MLNTDSVEGVKALIGTPDAKCDCRDVIAKPLGIRFAGTNWLWRSIKNSSKYRYLSERMRFSPLSGDLKPGDILFKIRDKVPEGYDDQPDAYHVAVYIGDEKIIHSSTSIGVREDENIYGTWQGLGQMKQVEYPEKAPQTSMTDHEMIKAIYNKICIGGND